MVADQYLAQKVADQSVQGLERQAAMTNKALSDSEKAQIRADVTTAVDKRQIVLIGHTDDTGNSEWNQKLSEKRARTVAQLFRERGIPVERIYYRGAGETDPIADNRTEEGRAKNRRVEIIDVASTEKLAEFINTKQPNLDYYRPRPSQDKVASMESDSDVKDGEAASEESSKASRVSSKKMGNKSSKTARIDHEATANPPTDMAVNDSDKTPSQPSTTDKGQNIAIKQEPRSEANTTAHARHVTEKSQQPGIDFGGIPVEQDNSKDITAAFGELSKPTEGVLAKVSSLFVKEAHASSEKIYQISCAKDSPRYGGEYISLKSGQPVDYKTYEFLPGLYKTSWGGTVNGNFLGVTPIGVLRADFKPVTTPNILVYANTERPNSTAKPDIKVGTVVNVYSGTQGLLYRMFSTDSKKLVCTDIVFPYKAPFQAKAGKLMYSKGGAIYATTFKPEILH